MASETTPLRAGQYTSDAQKRKRIVGITGIVVVLAAVIFVLWLSLSGHNSESRDVKGQDIPKPEPALRTKIPVAIELPTEAPTEKPAESVPKAAAANHPPAVGPSSTALPAPAAKLVSVPPRVPGPPVEAALYQLAQ
ncbi:hypothetical protein CCR75_003791 [Bremia lactucae]|uniref:Uncharacterized protein n=1 Tax=Bremia lactucae TaxID=4779 RepID=A0A976IKE1_BRELC|nr:hypothetical protein CCR75_003791 [Bremia lactucae]